MGDEGIDDDMPRRFRGLDCFARCGLGVIAHRRRHCHVTFMIGAVMWLLPVASLPAPVQPNRQFAWQSWRKNAVVPALTQEPPHRRGGPGGRDDRSGEFRGPGLLVAAVQGLEHDLGEVDAVSGGSLRDLSPA